MIDTDKYGMTNEELLERYSNLSVDDYKYLLAEVKRLRKHLEDCKRQIQYTADLIRDRGEDTHAKALDEFLGWME